MNSILHFSLKYHIIVILVGIMALIGSFYYLSTSKYDVLPEFAPPQVTLETEAPGFSSSQVELLVTQIIEREINGSNGITSMYSSSIQGLSVINIFFDNSSDVLKNRQVISEKLQSLASKLPSGVAKTIITPLSSTTNNILGVGLTSDKLNLVELRDLADWQIKPHLLAAGGVADVQSYGGLVREIQVQVDTEKLIRYGLSFDDIIAATSRATAILGAGVIDTSNQRITLNAKSSQTIESVSKAPITRGSAENIDLAITIGDVATVKESHKTPFNAASINGKKGILLMITSQYGANTLEVTQRLEKALEELRPMLKSQKVNLYGDLVRPANFIEQAISNVNGALMLGSILVIIVLFLFLHNWRAAVISALAIPFSLVGSAAMLGFFGLSLNTMTLGGLAIAVGLVVDDAVIDVENMLRRLHEKADEKMSYQTRFKTLLNASIEVRTPIIFATLAVVIVAIPIMTLPGLSGRFFAPLGFAYALATLFSLVVALTITPALAMAFLKEKHHELPKLTIWLQKNYVVILKKCFASPKILAIPIVILLIISGFGLKFLNSKFLPEMREGHFAIHMVTKSGTSLEESVRIGNLAAAEFKKFPFVKSVVLQVGRTEKGQDIWGTHDGEFNVALNPIKTSQIAEATQQITEALDKITEAEFSVKTFLTERIEEIISNHTSDAVLNIYGNDWDALDKSSTKIAALLGKIDGVKNIIQPGENAIPELSITLKPDALFLYGLSEVEVLSAIHSSYQGKVATQLYDKNHPTDVTVILDEKHRQNPTQLKDLPIRTNSGTFVKLGKIANLEQKAGRYLILHEGGQRLQTITFNIAKNKNAATVLNEVNKTIYQENLLPKGVYISLLSMLDAAKKSQHDLIFHSLMAVAAIFILLSFILPQKNQLLLIFINIPFALSGGIIATLLTSSELSLGAMVGFLTLFGMTLRNSVMLLSHYSSLVNNEGLSWNHETIIRGSVERLLPILMTALVTAIGLFPLALGSGEAGKEIEGPMAIVILGGLISSTILNLLAIPLLTEKFNKTPKLTTSKL